MKLVLALCALAAAGPSLAIELASSLAGVALAQAVGAEQALCLTFVGLFWGFLWAASQFVESSAGRVMGLRQEVAL